MFGVKVSESMHFGLIKKRLIAVWSSSSCCVFTLETGSGKHRKIENVTDLGMERYWAVTIAVYYWGTTYSLVKTAPVF